MSSLGGDTPGNGRSTPDERSDEDNGASKKGLPNAKRAKRKKASRACFHCQKAHLTCDDSRPCGRCVKRGLSGTCQDGVRKKAKYLRDVDNERMSPLQDSIKQQYQNGQRAKSEDHSRLQSQITSDVSVPVADVPIPEGTINLAAMSRPVNNSNGTETLSLLGDNILFDYPPLSSYDFDSKAANLEYSMLSTMLGNVMTPGTEQDQSPEAFSYSPNVKALQQNMTNPHADRTNSMKSESSQWSQAPFAGAPAPTLSHKSLLGGAVISSPPVAPRIAPSPQPTQPTQSQKPRQPSTQTYADPHGQRPTPVARRALTPSPGGDPTNIYKSITKPFSYTNGYHLLNTYLRSRFDKEDLLRIARAIVGYRPSFIALTKTLREEDLTFMEICFQRTLLEYEKFVGYSGTPTIIWRRTGQIELVGKEFCLLTQWSREQLLSKQTFIVELMDDSSVVEYFEKFSAHAFGDTSSVQTTCVLLTPQKKPVPCAFCFTIKRDVFDCPMMIVGNFLPVL